jgi:hypothetical protein
MYFVDEWHKHRLQTALTVATLTSESRYKTRLIVVVVLQTTADIYKSYVTVYI